MTEELFWNNETTIFFATMKKVEKK